MKILTKKYVVVYDEENKVIIARIQNGSEEFPTIAGGDSAGVEFDTEQELEDYISEHNLTE
jgi:hypothetical protein